MGSDTRVVWKFSQKRERISITVEQAKNLKVVFMTCFGVILLEKRK